MYQKGRKTGTLMFCIKPKSAKNVAIAGDFNNWKPARMRKQTDGSYTIELEVPPGRHAYKFVVDNAWMPDPDAKESAPDGFGSYNSILATDRTKEYAHAY